MKRRWPPRGGPLGMFVWVIAVGSLAIVLLNLVSTWLLGHDAPETLAVATGLTAPLVAAWWNDRHHPASRWRRR